LKPPKKGHLIKTFPEKGIDEMKKKEGKGTKILKIFASPYHKF
jgi:hypothetical protein